MRTRRERGRRPREGCGSCGLKGVLGKNWGERRWSAWLEGVLRAASGGSGLVSRVGTPIMVPLSQGSQPRKGGARLRRKEKIAILEGEKMGLWAGGGTGRRAMERFVAPNESQPGSACWWAFPPALGVPPTCPMGVGRGMNTWPGERGPAFEPAGTPAARGCRGLGGPQMPRVFPQILGEQPREKWAAPGSGWPRGGTSKGAGIWGRFSCAGRGFEEARRGLGRGLAEDLGNWRGRGPKRGGASRRWGGPSRRRLGGRGGDRAWGGASRGGASEGARPGRGRGSAAGLEAVLWLGLAHAARERRAGSASGPHPPAARPPLPIPRAGAGARGGGGGGGGSRLGCWARGQGGPGAAAPAADHAKGGGLGRPNHGGPGTGAEAGPGAGAGGRERGRERHPGGEPVWSLAKAAGGGGRGGRGHGVTPPSQSRRGLEAARGVGALGERGARRLETSPRSLAASESATPGPLWPGARPEIP